MLAKDKQMLSCVAVGGDKTLSLTYDPQNSSTKLIMLNFSKKESNKIRGHNKVKEGTKSLRNCCCVADSSQSNSCYHRDRDQLNYSRSHTTCFDANISSNKGVQLSTRRKLEKSSSSDKLPPCTNNNKKLVKPRKDSKHRSVYNRDLELLYSLPSLSHPDFTPGQRRVLLSLARIYTNITPIYRVNNVYIRREYSMRNPIETSKKSHDKKSKESPKNMHKKLSIRKGSLQTAVKTFTNEDEKLDNFEKVEIIKKKSPETSSLCSELNIALDDWISNIIDVQASSLVQASQGTDVKQPDIAYQLNDACEEYVYVTQVHEQSALINDYNRIEAEQKIVSTAEESLNIYSEENLNKKNLDIAFPNFETVKTLQNDHINVNDPSIDKVSEETAEGDTITVVETHDDRTYDNDNFEDEGDEGPFEEKRFKECDDQKSSGSNYDKDNENLNDNENEDLENDKFDQTQLESEEDMGILVPDRCVPLNNENVDQDILDNTGNEQDFNFVDLEIDEGQVPQRSVDELSTKDYSDDIKDNVNVLRHISDELRQMITNN